MQPINRHKTNTLNRDQALLRLADVVHKGARHPWYHRTVELSTLCRTLVTGDGMDEMLQQFVKREDKAAFEQRKALTQHITTSTVKNLMDVIEKVPRSNYKRILQHASTDNKTKKLELKLQAFWGAKSLDDYMKTRWLELNSTDASGFIVVEFEAFDNKKELAQSYPFEVSSTDAVDYIYENNVLQYLTVLSTFPMPTKRDSKKMGEKYTLYLANETVILTEVNPESAPKILSKEGDLVYNETGGYLLSKKRIFELRFLIPHKAGEVPAKPVGYLRDMWTSGSTYVAPFHSAIPRLKKSIKVNSEMDLTMSLSAFPFRAEYAPKCDAVDCYNGRTNDGSALCSTCKGTGHKSVTSAQEKLVLTLPKDTKDMIDLDKLVIFKSTDVDILKFQNDYIQQLTSQCKSDMFNSDIFTKAEVSDTATGKRLDLDNVYDTLFKCAQGYAETWEFLVRLTAKFAQLDTGLEAKLVFSKDFKLKGMSDLLSDLEAANRSQAGPAVKQAIQTDIARLLYADSPSGFLRWETRYRFDPFAGYSEDATNMALSDSSVPQRYKTQHLMLGVMFDELEEEAANETKDFYLLGLIEQRKRVAAKVEEYVSESGVSARPALKMPAAVPGPAAMN